MFKLSKLLLALIFGCIAFQHLFNLTSGRLFAETSFLEPASSIEQPLNKSVFFSPICLYPSYTAGKWLDNNTGYTSVNFYSVMSEWQFKQLTPIVDLKGHVFNNGKIAANLGMGARYQLLSDCIFGVNCFYDYRRGSWNHHFHQIGYGVEFLSNCIDVRFNGYFPLNQKAHSRHHTYTFDQYRAVCTATRYAVKGFDIEVGKWMFTCPHWNAYAALGTYYLSMRHPNCNEWGCQARVRSNIGRYVSIEVKGGYDKTHKGMIVATVNLENIFDWFSCCSYDPCKSILYQPIERRDLIVFGPKKCCWTWNWDSLSSN